MFRKHGPTGGETIQSYNHQARKEESFEKSYHSSTAGDDDNIDVVNDDDDKESGKESLDVVVEHHTVQTKIR